MKNDYISDMSHLDDGSIHLLPLGFIAILVGSMIFVSNRLPGVPILYFPPLAAAGYKLFVNPDIQGRISWEFPTALTYGALSGWVALVITERFFAPVAQGVFQVDPVGAVISILFTGIGFWVMDIELPPALAVGLLLPFAGLPPKLYTVTVAIGSTIVATMVWVGREGARGRQRE